MRTASVSLIVPVYQASRTIGRALESVFAQTRPPDEIVVVNDGSTDNLLKALLPFRGRISLLSKPHGGIASARNHGIAHTHGDLIAFLDADDAWEPDKLLHQLEVLSEHSQAALVAGRFYEQAPREPRVDVMPADERIMGRILSVRGSRAMELTDKISTSTVLVRRNALGGHRFVTSLGPAEDRDLWFRVLVEHPIYYSPRLLATRAVLPGSLAGSDPDTDCESSLRMFRRHGGSLGRIGLRRWEARCYRQWAAKHLANGRPQQALGPAFSGLRLQPFSPEAWWIAARAIKSARAGQSGITANLKGVPQ